ncbi:hypothetical protein [Aquimarina macrocephali]|uniref:hypothetical protein n=1 Tax=Aquimarina macrocephali TaxID=666563 RepID=UPI0004661BD2|nr:hypothetical protein [Aquimarina macrocephali]
MLEEDTVKPIFGGSDLSLDDLEPETEMITEVVSVPRSEKRVIEEIASETNFARTRSIKSEPRVIPMSISLFPEEHKIMSKIVSEYELMPEHIGTKASRSDVIRAALYFFNTAPIEKQVAMVAANRGRPKK